MFLPFNPPLTQWSGKRVWLIGASSGIGAALAQQLLQAGATVALSARRETELLTVAAAADLARVLPFDATSDAEWQSVSEQLLSEWGEIDLLLFCAADYRPQHSWQLQSGEAARTISINLGSVYLGLQYVLPAMLQNGRGGIGVIASVSGYFGLPNATVYGPTKAALINLAEILYADLHDRGLAVYLINPGFVATRLTDKNTFMMPALQTPQQAAASIVHGIETGKFEIHFPRRFTWWLKLIRLLPYRLRFILTRRLVREE